MAIDTDEAPPEAGQVQREVIPTIAIVRQWHKRFSVLISDTPHINDTDLNQLRINLLKEELQELDDALTDGDEGSVLDALADLQYVLDGTFLSLGFGNVKHEAVHEVHRSNMSKLGENGKPVRREDGKVLKGPNFEEPRLEQLLE